MLSSQSQKSALNKILDFVKYHNAFTIGLALALFCAGAIFAASPDARDAVLGKEIITARGVDNSRIINADLENFDFEMKIENVTEDETNYYVDYSFQTLGVKDNVWQIIARANTMTVSKASIAGQDLGLYVQAQLANIVQNELTYLKQAQAAERKNGLTQIVMTTEYTGLIGLVLDVKNAILPGYEPVVKPALSELAQDVQPQPPEQPQESELMLEPEINQNATSTQEIMISEIGNTETLGQGGMLSTSGNFGSGTVGSGTATTTAE